MKEQSAVIPYDTANSENTSFKVNEMFFSIQGEGRLAGTPMVFLRFAECNLRCSLANSGFDCDTEFMSWQQMSLQEILDRAQTLNPQKGWLLFTGGEPGLQVNAKLINALREAGWKLAIETNGTVKLPDQIDWICVSPKSAEHTIKQRKANEAKYVRRAGMALPESVIEADHYLISPAFEADGTIAKETLDWCFDLVKKQPAKWSISIQYHKLTGIR